MLLEPVQFSGCFYLQSVCISVDFLPSSALRTFSSFIPTYITTPENVLSRSRGSALMRSLPLTSAHADRRKDQPDEWRLRAAAAAAASTVRTWVRGQGRRIVFERPRSGTDGRSTRTDAFRLPSRVAKLKQ